MPQKKHPSDQMPTANRASTSYSKARYAHPFFLTAPQGQRQPINGHTHMTDWSNQQLGPIPPVAREGNLDLSEVIGAAGVKEIEDLGEIRFHALGDSGVEANFAQVFDL